MNKTSRNLQSPSQNDSFLWEICNPTTGLDSNSNSDSGEKSQSHLSVGRDFKNIFCTCAHSCIDTINSMDALGFHSPQPPHWVETAARGFRSISPRNTAEGCVASVDGILIKTGAPKNHEVGGIKALFLGITTHVVSKDEKHTIVLWMSNWL